MAASRPRRDLDSRNRRLAARLALVAVLFGGFGFALVPLYDVICRATGLNGRTNAAPDTAAANTQVDASRWVKVEFLAHAMPGVALDMQPEVFSMVVHPGAIAQVRYKVRNLDDRGFVGQAVPSITPAVAATQFRKIECFCFRQQAFRPGEERSMPVVFVVDPALSPDIRTVTLSYTFFEAPKSGA